MPKKKITTMDDINRKNEEKERERNVQKVKTIFFKNLPPQIVQKIEQALREEEIRRRGKNKLKKAKETVGTIFAFLLMIVAIFGCIWLIKIFIKGIFG